MTGRRWQPEEHCTPRRPYFPKPTRQREHNDMTDDTVDGPPWNGDVPRPAYEPMPRGEREKEEAFSSDADGLRKAAASVTREREPRLIERKYQYEGGEDHGKDMPPHLTTTLAEA